jgi:hypothetical protein
MPTTRNNSDSSCVSEWACAFPSGAYFTFEMEITPDGSVGANLVANCHLPLVTSKRYGNGLYQYLNTVRGKRSS